MTITVRSIDKAASGLLRLSFMRAMSASTLMLLVFLAGSFFLYVLYGQNSYVLTGVNSAALPALYAMLFALFILGPIVFFVLVVSLGSAIVDFLHRRLIAFLALIVAGSVLVGFAYAVSRFIPGVTPVDTSELWRDAVAEGYTPVVLIAFYAVWVAAVCVEVSVFAWWQLTLRRSQFLAARGWRPSPLRPITNAFRRLGLPSFLAVLGVGGCCLGRSIS